MRFQEKHYPGTGDEMDPLLEMSFEGRRRRGKAIRLAMVLGLIATGCILLLIFAMLTANNPEDTPVSPPLPPGPFPVAPVAPPVTPPPSSSVSPPVSPSVPPSPPVAPTVAPSPPVAPGVLNLVPPAPMAPSVLPIREAIPGHDWTRH